MITYIGKLELQATMGMGTWHVPQSITTLEYNDLDFDENFYNIGGNIYLKDCQDARDAFEKERLWNTLLKTKKRYIDILKDFGLVEDEIAEHLKKSKQSPIR